MLKVCLSEIDLGTFEKEGVKFLPNSCDNTLGSTYSNYKTQLNEIYIVAPKKPLLQDYKKRKQSPYKLGTAKNRYPGQAEDALPSTVHCQGCFQSDIN